MRRGNQVAEGEPVFVLEQANEQAARVEEEQRLKSAEAKLSNLQVGRRIPEVDAIRAQLAQAQAARELSRTQLAQQERLFKGGFISAERMVEVRAAFQRDVARVAEAEAQIRTALLPLGRNAELVGRPGRRRGGARIACPGDLASAAEERFRPGGELRAGHVFRRRRMGAGRPARRRPAAAGQRQGALLRPGNRSRVALARAKAAEIACDGCGAPIAAKITFISSQAEYTPPVIYSKESRSKLVFLVEARPDPKDAARLHPGQPVDVKVAAK